MEENLSFKKDTKPYIIFRCLKCEQYQYVKKSQKTKKCLRCGKRYEVEKIIEFEMVNGMTEAVQRVIELQNNIARKKGYNQTLTNESSFIINSQKSSNSSSSNKNNTLKNTLEEKFLKLLRRLSLQYQEFPKYMIELELEEFQIPKKALNSLILYSIKNGYLKHCQNKYYKIYKLD